MINIDILPNSKIKVPVMDAVLVMNTWSKI